MKGIIHISVTKGEKYYVAECLDFPIVTQALTLDELVANLTDAIVLHFEGEDLAEHGLTESPSVLISMELPAMHAKA